MKPSPSRSADGHVSTTAAPFPGQEREQDSNKRGSDGQRQADADHGQGQASDENHDGSRYGDHDARSPVHRAKPTFFCALRAGGRGHVGPPFSELASFPIASLKFPYSNRQPLTVRWVFWFPIKNLLRLGIADTAVHGSGLIQQVPQHNPYYEPWN